MNRTWISAWIVLGLTWVTVALGDEADTTAIYQLDGQSIALTTDLVSRQEARTLVESFDAAVIQWAEFWQLSEQQIADWKVEAYVMRDKTAFVASGLIPDRLPDFPFGYALDSSVWILAQPSQYYTRHLLLHEGAHALAFHCFGGGGPTWFMEGSAELLATHRDAGSSVQTIAIPDDRHEFSYWGRFKKMSLLRESSSLPAIETVMAYPPTLTGDVRAYGWSWAAASMFTGYPQYRDDFLAAAKRGRDTSEDFNRQFRSRLAGQWPIVAARWRLLSSDFDFGFDWNQQRVDIAIDDPVWDGRPIKLSVDAARGWQSIGVRIPTGANVSIRADGEVTLADDPQPWISEPPGVTIEYHNGRPLGQLIACVLPNRTARRGNLEPVLVQSVGRHATIKFDMHAWLLLKVNDAVGDLNNNTGAYEVTLK